MFPAITKYFPDRENLNFFMYCSIILTTTMRLTSTIELECVDNVEIVIPLLLPQSQTAFEAVSLLLLAHEIVLISHLHAWLCIGFPFFAFKNLIIRMLIVFLGLFFRVGRRRGEGNYLSVFWEGEMFKRQKVLMVLGVKSSCRYQVP